MTVKVRTIEIDAETADALEARAAARGVSITALIEELMGVDRGPGLAEADPAELDRRWQAIEAGEQTVPHEKVVRWLEGWGKPSFKLWRDQ